MANALVVRHSKAVVAQNAMRAVRYVRISTDYQRCSIESQAAIIATYAQVHRLKIVLSRQRDHRQRYREATLAEFLLRAEWPWRKALGISLIEIGGT